MTTSMLIACGLLLSQGPVVRAQSFRTPNLTQEGQRAFQILLTASKFEDKAIGYAGTPSTLVEAYRIISREAEADRAFRHLLEHATLPGQLYALCGLYFTDRPFFRLVVQEYRNNSREVVAQFGCVIMDLPVSRLIEATKPVVIDPADPDKSLAYWMDLNEKTDTEWGAKTKKAKGERPPEPYELDILNGGYPTWFKSK